MPVKLVKPIAISVMAICLSLNGFSQKCVKFIDYQNKTVNTKGLSMQIPGLPPVSIGETSISTLQRVASDKLQSLDFLQYNICSQLGRIKNEFIREKLQTQYTNLLMKMMSLLKLENSSTAQPIAPAPTQDLGNVAKAMETPVAQSETKQNEETIPAYDPVDDDISTIPSSIDEDIDVDISFPCGDYSTSAPGSIRSFGMEASMDAQIAKRIAHTATLEELASKIEVTVKTVTDYYVLRTKNNLDEQLETRYETKTRTIVNRTLSGYVTSCEKFQQNKSTKKYTCYIALEISQENILRPIFNELKNDNEIKNDLPNYEKFNETFNDVMDEYEKSRSF